MRRRLFDSWNWKSAIASAVLRASIFFATNLTAGLDAALDASRTEFLYRIIAAGFYGALTQQFAGWRAARLGTAAALFTLPVLTHTVEYIIHDLAGTARVGTSVAASVALTLTTTRFHLFAMRRGLFRTGQRSQSLLADCRQLATMGVTAWARAQRRLRSHGAASVAAD